MYYTIANTQMDGITKVGDVVLWQPTYSSAHAESVAALQSVYVKSKPGFMLAGLAGMRWQEVLENLRCIIGDNPAYRNPCLFREMPDCDKYKSQEFSIINALDRKWINVGAGVLVRRKLPGNLEYAKQLPLP